MAEPPLPDAMYEPLVGDLAAIAAEDELVVQSVAVVLHGPIRNLRFHMCMGFCAVVSSPPELDGRADANQRSNNIQINARITYWAIDQ
jgi:hypothetical protein